MSGQELFINLVWHKSNDEFSPDVKHFARWTDRLANSPNRPIWPISTPINRHLNYSARTRSLKLNGFNYPFIYSVLLRKMENSKTLTPLSASREKHRLCYCYLRESNLKAIRNLDNCEGNLKLEKFRPNRGISPYEAVKFFFYQKVQRSRRGRKDKRTADKREPEDN